jgi:hypothetical protein
VGGGGQDVISDPPEAYHRIGALGSGGGRGGKTEIYSFLSVNMLPCLGIYLHTCLCKIALHAFLNEYAQGFLKDCLLVCMQNC